MRTFAKIAGLGLLLVLVAACVPGSAESHQAAAGGWISQLLLGFWQGIIAPLTLLGEVVNKFAPHALPWTLHMYETTGASMPYDVGFYFGLLGGPGAILGGWSRRG